MSRSLSYKNVTKQRFNCMKSAMHSKVNAFAKKNNYKITLWSVPNNDISKWQVRLESNKMNKPSLDFIANVKRSNSNVLTIDLVHMPGFISAASAVNQVNSVYKSCSP